MPFGPLVDLEMDDEEKLDRAIPDTLSKPDSPWGLRISLTEKELAKLGLDCDCEIGDMIDLRAFATVTSISQNEGSGGKTARVELQIEKMAVELEIDRDGDEDE